MNTQRIHFSLNAHGTQFALSPINRAYWGVRFFFGEIMLKASLIVSLIVGGLFYSPSAYPETQQGTEQTTAVASLPVAKPYRTFVTIQKYTVENSGSHHPQSNVRLEITFPGGSKVALPENGQYWPIGNGQVQEINRTFEIPWSAVKNDGFQFRLQMVRQGSKLLPCEFDVSSLSQFNRSYVCHTDVNWQLDQKVASENVDKEGVQIRVFTDKNSQPNEIPQNSIALR